MILFRTSIPTIALFTFLSCVCHLFFLFAFLFCFFLQRAVNQMVSGVQQYQAALLEHLKHQMSNMIETHSGDLGQLKSDVMGVFDQFNDPFSQIATTHLQDKTIKELLQPVEPETII